MKQSLWLIRNQFLFEGVGLKPTGVCCIFYCYCSFIPSKDPVLENANVMSCIAQPYVFLIHFIGGEACLTQSNHLAISGNAVHVDKVQQFSPQRYGNAKSVVEKVTVLRCGTNRTQSCEMW